MDPTSRGDMCADLMRRWYEDNRENWWDRLSRRKECADNFAIGMMNEAVRISKLSDKQIYKETYGD